MPEQDHNPISVEELSHAFDDEVGNVDLKPYSIEDWVTLAMFWGMALCVFLQFFTRYALNDSLAWTEEIAANFLVMIVFLGSVMCVRMGRHISVDLLHRLVPSSFRRPLEVFTDAVVIIFFAYMTWVLWRYVKIVGGERMTTVDLPRGFVFYTVMVAFVLMLLRSIQNFVTDLKQPQSVYEEVDDSGPTGI